jgi:hypothetical protein
VREKIRAAQLINRLHMAKGRLPCNENDLFSHCLCGTKRTRIIDLWRLSNIADD